MRINHPHHLGFTFAQMFGQMVYQYIVRGESEANIYLLAVRAFHNARVALGD